jgi:hypothetical protein
LAQWKGSMTWRDGVMTLARGEVAPGRENGGDDTSCAGVNLTRPKNEEGPHG